MELFGYTFEHIASARAVGNPVYMYIVTAEDGYYINTPRLDSNIYKTVTTIYETDDFDAIIIIPASELPEDAEILDATPETETASVGEQEFEEVSE